LIEDILEQTHTGYVNKKKNQKSYYKRKKIDKVDEIIQYCENCKMTWQYTKVYGGSKRKRHITKYDHIPTIGKVRTICPLCNKEKL
jgi:hypothetical protein